MTASATSPHVVLLPGNMCDARLWSGGDGIILDTLKAHVGSALTILDFGRDDSIAAMAQRALTASTGPLIPIGFSMGGIVALEMARQAPQRIAALCLIDTNCHADRRGPERLRQQEDVRAGQLARVVIEELKPNYLAPSNAHNEALLALVAEMACALGPDIFVAQSEALRTRADLCAVLPSLRVPTFFACGAHDTLCTPDLHRAMAAQVKDAQLHMIGDAGHMLPLEQPHQLANALDAFLISILGAPQ